jgi:signal transduction histidine kinase
MEPPLHILHLEDDPYDVELIQETLKRESVPCTITHASNRAEFLLALEQTNFDLILADFALPAFNGLEALALAREKHPDVPYIFVSGAIGEEKAIETLKQGATDYVLKHRLPRLVPAIQRALREVEERAQRQQVQEQLRQSKDQLARLFKAERKARQAAEAVAVRIASLQVVTASLSEALTPTQVAQIVVEQGLAVLGAAAGSVVLRTEQENMLEIIHAAGYSTELLQSWQCFTLDAPVPLAEAVRTGEPVFLESIQAAEHFPLVVAQAKQSSHSSWASIPLAVEGKIIGAMGLSFNHPQTFTADDRNFMLALGRQCAQAMDRARLYEAERLARAEANRLNMELEQRVQQRTALVRRLASELITSEQAVRQRMAQTLHDDLQQILYAAKIQLQFLREDIGENEVLTDLADMIVQSWNLTRQLTMELSPPVVKGEGLREALAWLAWDMREFHGLQVTIKANDYLDTASLEQRILLYQVVRELLFNVVKHAGVREAELLLQTEEGGFSVTVSDQGQGFDVAEILANARSGFGLPSMHERLQLFDGRAEIDSKPGGGARVTLFLPHA